MPSRPLRTPGTYVPTDEELLAAVRRRPGASLREVAGAVYPDTAWTSASASADSIADRIREWQAPTGRGRPGNRVLRLTAAEYLRDRLAELVEAGRLRYAPRRRDEVSLAASVAYLAAGAELPRPGPDPLEAIARGRREVSHG